MLGHFDEIMHGLSKNNDTDSIYLDYAKAFDKVDHKLLLAKLQRYGFSCKFISWIKSFLTNRPQNVVLDGVHSYIAMILSGVPQGTVLGPILFILFINDLEHCVKHSTVRFFADDTRISKQISSENDVDLLQNNFETIIGTVTRNSACIRDVNHNLTGTSHESILLNLIHSSFRLDVPSTKKKKKDVPSTKKKKKKNPQQAQVEPLSVFFTELRGQVVKQLESFTNLDCPPGGKTDHSISVFANKKFTQSYFSPSCKVPEFRKDYVTEPHNPSSVRLSDHLITIGRAISANFGMKEKVASNLKELDGYLNECKLGKIHLNIKNQSIPSTFSIGSPIFSLHRIDR